MKTLWRKMSRLQMDESCKWRLFLGMNMVVAGITAAVIGGFIGFGLQLSSIAEKQILIALIGYSALFFGFYFGIIFLMRNTEGKQ